MKRIHQLVSSVFHNRGNDLHRDQLVLDRHGISSVMVGT